MKKRLFVPLWLAVSLIPALKADAGGLPPDTGKTAAVASVAPENATQPLGGVLARSLAGFLEKKGLIAAKDDPKDDGLVTLNFKDQDINNVIKFISEQTGKAVIKGDEVQGKFTIICPTRITKEKALDFILVNLEMKGITWIETDDLIQFIPLKSAPTKVLAIETGPDIPLDSRVRTLIMPLEFANPTKIAEAIKPLLSETASVIPDDRTKSLFITASGTDLARMRKIIAALDVPDREGALEQRVIRLRHAQAGQMAKTLSALVEHLQTNRADGSPAGGAQKPTTKIFSDDQSNSIIALGTAEDLRKVQELIDELDTTTAGDFETEVFRLEAAEARSVADAIYKTLSIRKTSFAEPKVVPNQWTNSVVVSCMPDDMESVRNLIKDMDTLKTQDRDTKIFPLKNADSRTVYQILDNMFYERRYTNRYYRGYGSQQQPDNSILVMADERLNAIIVNALAAELPQIEALINELDQPTEEGDVKPKFYKLENAGAEEVAKALNDLFSAKSTRSLEYTAMGYVQTSDYTNVGGLSGRIRVVPELITNSIVVIASTARAFEVVEEIIEQLDQEPQELGSTRIIKLQNANAVDVAKALNNLFKKEDSNQGRSGFYPSLYGQRGKEGEISDLVGKVRIVPEGRTNSLLVTTSKRNMETLENMVKQLDTEVSQVLIEVLIVEVLLTDLDELGIDWGDQLAVGTKGEAEFSRTEREVSRTLPDDSVESRIVPHKFDRYSFLSSAEYNIVLNYLSSKTVLNVMSRPNIITTNNRRAHLSNVFEVPVPTNISTTNTGTLSSFRYRDVGLILDVTPTVSVESGLVVMDTQLTTGSVLGSDPVRVGDTEFNRFTKREIRTNIGVKGGETVVIGGVISEDKSTVKKKVPFLGSIPVMGALFRNTREVRTKSELITFITPYIIEKPENMYEVTRMQRDRIKAFELLESDSIKNHLESVMMPKEVPQTDVVGKKKNSGRKKQ